MGKVPHNHRKLVAPVNRSEFLIFVGNPFLIVYHAFGVVSGNGYRQMGHSEGVRDCAARLPVVAGRKLGLCLAAPMTSLTIVTVGESDAAIHECLHA